jgi:hypothetical protein
MTLGLRVTLAPPLVARSSHRRRRATFVRVAPRAETMLAGETQLEALRSVTRLVVDTGDIDKIALWKPTDATTNPRCGRRLDTCQSVV